MAKYSYLAQQRRALLRTLLLATLPTAAGYAAFNVYSGALLVSLLLLILLFVALGLLFAMRQNAPLEGVASIFLSFVLTPISAALLTPQVHPSVYGWLSALPVGTYLLLPLRLARPFTLLSLLIAGTAYCIGAKNTLEGLDAVDLARVLLPALVLSFICDLSAHGQIRTEEEMLERALTDPLSGLGNRAKLTSDFQREKLRSQRTGMPLSLILIDLDRFKRINDTYGHEAGDATLTTFSRLVRGRIRQTDMAYRFGGEEFAVLLPATTALDAVTVAEDLRRRLEESTFNYRGAIIRTTLSAGVVELGRDGDDWLQLYRAADARLYACKERGRNQVLSTLARTSRSQT